MPRFFDAEQAGRASGSGTYSQPARQGVQRSRDQPYPTEKQSKTKGLARPNCCRATDTEAPPACVFLLGMTDAK